MIEPRTSIVVPLFEPTAAVIDNVLAAAGQATVVAVDDGSSAAAADVLTQIEQISGVRLVRLGANAGIATALNVGVDAAADTGCLDFVVTIDQDTLLPDRYVERAVAVLEESGEDLALVYPEYLGGVRQPGKGHGQDYRAREPMQSGWVLRASTFRQLGPFLEDLVIDCVDTEYFMRLQRAGYQSRPIFDVNLPHELGTRRTVRGNRAYRFHAPERRYYIVRNRLRVALMYGSFAPRWAMVSVVYAALNSARALWLGPRRAETLCAILRGLRDAIRGRAGRRPPGESTL